MSKVTLRRFGHIERMEKEEFVKKMYLSNVEGSSRRGRSLRRWEDRVKEYMSERGVRGNGLEQGRRECMDRERLPGGTGGRRGRDLQGMGRERREEKVGTVEGRREEGWTEERRAASREGWGDRGKE